MTLEARALLHATPPFSQFPVHLLQIAAADAHWVSLPAGAELFAAGDDAEALYIVAEGRLREALPGPTDVLVAERGANVLVGEVPVLTGGRRVTTVRAAVDSRLLRLPRASIDFLTSSDATVAAAMNAVLLRRLRRDRCAAILAQLFDSPGPQPLEDIMAAGEWVTLPQGQDLMRQGDEGDSFWLLINGLLGVSVRAADGVSRLVNRLHSGDVIGEMAILTEDRRTATVFAIRESELVQFSKSTFFDLAGKHPAFLLRIARLNIERLRRALGTVGEEAATAVVSVIPLSPAVPIADLTRRLAAELSSYCRVLHLTAARVDEEMEAPGAAQSPPHSPLQEKLLAWLSAQLGTCHTILVEADAGDSNWTRTCIRQSDQMILVGNARGDPATAPIEALVAPAGIGGVPLRLVLLHPDDATYPEGTGAWLEGRRLEMHHHVRLGRREDIRRLARFLNGCAVCLALGGGGARAFAQIGVLRAFREAGVAIDMIAGTSMGAVVGAEQAMGLRPDEMLAVNRDMFQTTGLLLDLTLPLLSLTTGKPYVKKLKHVFGDLQSEDLWIPFVCVSSNISRARKVLHTSGPLWRNLRASSGVQGLFPPVVLDGDLHVDGALFSNLPADVVKSAGAGRVIAVDVTPPVDLAENTDYGDTVSGFWILWRRLFPGRRPFRMADIGTVLQRAAEAASMASQKQVIETTADFYLRLPVEHVGLLNFAAIDELERIGYAAAKEKIPEWRASLRWVES